jgi:hypothetical protein
MKYLNVLLEMMVHGLIAINVTYLIININILDYMLLLHLEKEVE